MPAVVLITGVSRYLGGRLAAQLATDPSIERVIGIDTVPPAADARLLLGRTEFVRADIRNPLIATVVAQARVTTVVHASLMASPRGVGGRVSMQELNVIGTMQLLAACQKSDSLERLVLKSTTAVYGCGPSDPAVFTEDMPTAENSPAGYTKDAVEVEGYVRGFARRRPDVDVTVLRLADLLGPTADSALARYLRGPIVAATLGFDPRLQLLHETDAIEVLRLAALSSRAGVFNVAGAGVMTLSQVVRRLGGVRVPLPRRVAGPIGSVVRNAGRGEVEAEEARFLEFGRVVDTSLLRSDFGYATRHTTAATVDSFAGCAHPALRLGLAGLGVLSQLVQARGRHPAVSSG